MCYALAVIPGWSEGPDPPFLLNGATELLKWLTSANTTGGKARFILAVLSMIGVLSPAL
jgi:hypothetical protein